MKTHCLILLYAILYVALVPVKSYAQEVSKKSYKIIGIYLAGRLDEDPRSGYNQLIKAILPMGLYAEKYHQYPYVRAARDFKSLEHVCLFPASISSINRMHPDNAFNLAISDAIDIVSSHIITAQGQPTIRHFKELRGKKIVVKNAVNTRQIRAGEPLAEVWRIPNDVTALKMVQAGRATAMYGWFPDIFIIAQQHTLPLPHFDPDFTIYETTTHITCKQFDGHQDMLVSVNKRIAELKANGQMQEILGQYARIVEPQ